jgi:protein-disulfide isomerase
LRKYKYYKNLFKGLLNEEAKYALLDKESSLIIGNAEAENVITMVSNPFCQPCAKTHKQLEWLKRRDDVMLQVVFATENDTDNYAEVAWHLLAMQQDRNDTSLEKALDTWYELKIKDFAAWAKVHPKTTTVENDGILEKHREWCALTEIKGTPTLFLNGRKIPQDYKPEDLKYFI